MMKSKLIVVEGQDGSGKTTLCDQLEKYLIDKGHKVKRATAFGSGVIGTELRRIWLSGDRPQCSNTTEMFVYLTAAMDSMAMAEQAIEEGYHVIMDRWFMSSFVYQYLLKRNKLTEPLAQATFDIITTTVMKFTIQPDLILYCNADLETIHENLENRGGLNHMDKLSPQALKTAYEVAYGIFKDSYNLVDVSSSRVNRDKYLTVFDNLPL